MSLLDVFGRSKPHGLPTLTPEQRQKIQDIQQARDDADRESEREARNISDLRCEEAQRASGWGEDMRKPIIVDGHVISGRIIDSK